VRDQNNIDSLADCINYYRTKWFGVNFTDKYLLKIVFFATLTFANHGEGLHTKVSPP